MGPCQRQRRGQRAVANRMARRGPGLAARHAGGPAGMAGGGLMREMEGPLPEHLGAWWTQDLWCLHSAAWWRRHWERTGIMNMELADTMPDGWQRWLDWLRAVAPDNEAEIK